MSVPNGSKPKQLKRRAIDVLLRGRHARLGGTTIPTRAKNLLRIAAEYSWDELLEEPSVGLVTAREYGSGLKSEAAR